MKNQGFFNVLPTPQFAIKPLFGSLLPQNYCHFHHPDSQNHPQILPRVIRELSPGAQILLTDPQKSRKSSPGSPRNPAKAPKEPESAAPSFKYRKKAPQETPGTLQYPYRYARFPSNSSNPLNPPNSSNPLILQSSYHHVIMPPCITT